MSGRESSSSVIAPARPVPTVEPGRPRVLCVDDDERVLQGLCDVLGRTFVVHTATDPVEALELLKREPDAFAVVLCDMRMPVLAGAEFLRMARIWAPYTVRILLSGYADVPSAIRAVNGGQVFRYLAKPCDSRELMRACAAAAGQHRLQLAERTLLRDTLRGCVNALAEVLAITNPAAFGQAGRVRELAGALARRAGLSDWWEVEVAALLRSLGAVILPAETTHKLYAGLPLSEREAAMVERVPTATHQLLGKIPRLEGVLEIITSCSDPASIEPVEPVERPGSESAGRPGGEPAGRPDGAAAQRPGREPPGAGILRTVIDFVELEDRETPAAVAIAAMRSTGRYAEGLLEQLAGLIGVDGAPEVREVTVAELDIGMTLANDARTTDGALLMARGQQVTRRLIELIDNLAAGTVREPLLVIVQEASL